MARALNLLDTLGPDDDPADAIALIRKIVAQGGDVSNTELHVASLSLTRVKDPIAWGFEAEDARAEAYAAAGRKVPVDTNVPC